jgi:hypothetical protein
VLDVVLNLPTDVLRRVETIAQEQERSRAQQLRYLVKLGLAQVERGAARSDFPPESDDAHAQ